MNLPDEKREALRERLWGIADEIGWLSLGATAKSLQYKNWTKDPEIGGVLSRYMDVREVRVYIKDSLLKDYPQHRMADHRLPFRLLGIPEATVVLREFTKPHGVRLAEGQVICWGGAKEWKTILLAVHERSFGVAGAIPYGVVLLRAAARFGEASSRAVVEDAARKLGISKIVWQD